MLAIHQTFLGIVGIFEDSRFKPITSLSRCMLHRVTRVSGDYIFETPNAFSQNLISLIPINDGAEATEAFTMSFFYIPALNISGSSNFIMSNT